MRRHPDQAGAVAVLVAICSLALFVIAALVVDLGLARDTRRESQNAADSAALAGANALYPVSGKCSDGTTTPASGCKSDAAARAKTYADTNVELTAADWASCPAPPTGYAKVGTYPQCISVDSAGKHVWVVIPDRNVPFGFGAAADQSSVDVGSAARATVTGGASASCAICFLGSISTVKFDLVASGAGIAVNGNVTGNKGTWTAATISVLDPTKTDSKLAATPATTATAAFGDPWATNPSIPPAIPVGTANKGTTNPCSASGGPGKYGAVTLPNSACALKPGLYVITGAWAAKNNTVLSGTGVTLYFTCGTAANPAVCNAGGQAGGWLDMKNGSLRISSPNAGALAGLAVIYDRGNNSPMTLQGNGAAISVAGAIYAPSSVLDFNGTSNVNVTGGPIILKGATGNGTTGFTVTGASSVVYSKSAAAIALDR